MASPLGFVIVWFRETSFVAGQRLGIDN